MNEVAGMRKQTRRNMITELISWLTAVIGMDLAWVKGLPVLPGLALGLLAGTVMLCGLGLWADRPRRFALGVFVAATPDLPELAWRQPKRRRRDRLVEATIVRPETGEEKIVLIVRHRERTVEGYDRPVILTPGAEFVASLGPDEELPPLVTTPPNGSRRRPRWLGPRS